MRTIQSPLPIFSRHERVALEFSGGKDSMACLYLLRPYWDRLTVYWCNTGDPLPETMDVMRQVHAMVPNFVEVQTDVAAWREQNGIPSDLVPTNSTIVGRTLGFGDFKVSDRFQCCYENVMAPTHAQVLADGNTCIIRGQKLCDMPTVPFKSGDVVDGVEFYFPIEDWSHEEVLEYLDGVGAIRHPCYEDGNHIGVDCAHCTAWWGESHFGFLKKRHPVIWHRVSSDLVKLRKVIDAELQHFPEE